MALMTFARTSAPTGSWSPTTNPKTFAKKERYYQPKEFADGGDLYAYDKAINPEKIRTLQWSIMPLTDFDNLMTFFEAVKETRYNFTFTDHVSSASSARFISGIDATFVDDSYLTVSFDIRLE